MNEEVEDFEAFVLASIGLTLDTFHELTKRADTLEAQEVSLNAVEILRRVLAEAEKRIGARESHSLVS